MKQLLLSLLFFSFTTVYINASDLEDEKYKGDINQPTARIETHSTISFSDLPNELIGYIFTVALPNPRIMELNKLDAIGLKDYFNNNGWPFEINPSEQSTTLKFLYVCATVSKGFYDISKDHRRSFRKLLNFIYQQEADEIFKKYKGQSDFCDNDRILHLLLSNQNLKRIPSQILDRKSENISSLILDNTSSENPNIINLLTPQIENLSILNLLNLSNNQVRSLPKEFAKLGSLKILHLNGNLLDPSRLFFPKSLHKLWLNECGLKELPETMKSLVHLRTIYLKKNQFEEFPPVLLQLKTLHEIDLSYNQIKNIPQEIDQLTELKEINLSNNKISDLPSKRKTTRLGRKRDRVIFYFHNNLQKLYLSKTPLSAQTKNMLEVLEKSPKKKNLEIQFLAESKTKGDGA